MGLLKVYFKDGRIFSYPVKNAERAREHMDKIWQSGYRSTVDDVLTWYGPHYLDKIKYVPAEGEVVRTDYGDQCHGT